MPSNPDANSSVQYQWTPPKALGDCLSIELRVMPQSPADHTQILVDLIRKAQAESRPYRIVLEVPANAAELHDLEIQGLNPEPAYHSASPAVVGPIMVETFREVLDQLAENLSDREQEYEQKYFGQLPLPVKHNFCDLAAREMVVSDDARPDIAAVVMMDNRSALRAQLAAAGLQPTDLLDPA